MLELVGCLPSLHTNVSKDLKWIKDQLSAAKDEIREYAAALYGLVLSISVSDVEFETAIKTLIKDVNNKNFETQHGSILAIGNCLEMKALHTKGGENHMQLVKNSIETLGELFFLCFE